MTPDIDVMDTAGKSTTKKFRIGLALSGGGFRASIFHLGVIRRLEELGIMKDVDAVSSVSGGSIIAAYYVCEMETRLRQVDPGLWRDSKTRVEIFESIARDFLKAVDHNLRTRALIFTPFYYPILFVKTLVLKATFRAGARSELIQREYDKWFYNGNTIDQLPSVTPEQSKVVTVLHGPQIILNTTSLLSGERVSFSREPNSRMTEIKRANKNSLPLARVVGASSGVPVLFPPTHIYGDMLIDGGVADNQGIEALLPGEQLSEQSTPQILLISDASGQMEAIHTISNGEAQVFLRVNDILQFQVRSKLIDRLIQWQVDEPNDRNFAFSHLYLNLKDRGVSERLPSEMIPGVARIRTDLDQFSYVERDALMYHGYTLMDAQIRKYCPTLANAYFTSDAPPLTAPPLFSATTLATTEKRDRIRKELEAGAQKVFFLRSLKKYPLLVGLIFALWIVALLGSLDVLFGQYTAPLALIQGLINEALSSLPATLDKVVDWLLYYAKLPPRAVIFTGIANLLSDGMLIAVTGYVLAFPAYQLVRYLTNQADRGNYRDLTGKTPSTKWETQD